MSLIVKNWNEYTKEEQKQLLMHWWQYYGKTIYSFDELIKFDELAENNSKQVFDFILYCLDNNQNGQTLLVYSFRSNETNKLMDLFSKLDEGKDYLEKSRNLIIQLVSSYNNPEPDIPLSKEEIKKQLRYFFNKKEDDLK